MSELADRSIDAHSLWRNNPVLVHMFGLTPLLALSTTVLLGTTLLLIMGVLVLAGSAISSLLLGRINANWRFLVNLTLLALLATLASLLLDVWKPMLHEALGIYLPLLSCSLLPLLHLQTCTPDSGFSQRLLPLGKLLAGYGLAVIMLAMIREGLTYGGLFTDLGLFMAGMASTPQPSLLPFAATPAGGFLLLGLLAAAATWLRQWLGTSQVNHKVEPAPRARVTEKLQ